MPKLENIEGIGQEIAKKTGLSPKRILTWIKQAKKLPRAVHY